MFASDMYCDKVLVRILPWKFLYCFTALLPKIIPIAKDNNKEHIFEIFYNPVILTPY